MTLGQISSQPLGCRSYPGLEFCSLALLHVFASTLDVSLHRLADLHQTRFNFLDQGFGVPVSVAERFLVFYSNLSTVPQPKRGIAVILITPDWHRRMCYTTSWQVPVVLRDSLIS